MSNHKKPTFFHERGLLSAGYFMVAGVDEAGVGALAGPVVASAVVLPLDSRIGNLDDSKKVSAAWRERLYGLVTARALAWAVGMATNEEIDEIGIRPANYLAMRRAIDQIFGVDFVLVDAWTLPDLKISQLGIIRGDQKVKSIAAASIIAKVTRDRLMLKHHQELPQYGFDRHKGYGTEFHRTQIKKFGPCSLHRRSFLRNFLSSTTLGAGRTFNI